MVYAGNDLVSPIEEYKNKAIEFYKALDGREIFSMFLQKVPESFREFSSNFGICICVILISGLFSILGENFGTRAIFDIISKCVIILCCLYPLMCCLDRLERCLSSLCAYMIAFIPTSAYLHAVGGNTVTATVTTPALSYAITILEFITCSILLPCIKAMCTVMCVNLLCKKANLDGIFGLIKSFSLWVTGLSFTIFTSLISLQSLLSASADNLAMKGLKYGAARLIPIAGGMISESMRTVVASTSFIKSVTGMGGIIFVIYTILPTLFILLSGKLFFFLAGCFNSFCSNSSISSFFSSATQLLNIMLSLLLGASVSFIIMFAIFIKTTVVI